MEKQIEVKEEYLYLPIQTGQKKELLEIFSADGKKIFEFQIPVGDTVNNCYPADYFARFPVKKFTDKTLILKGTMPEEFFDAIENAPMRKHGEELRHPSIHFVPEMGWMNDPNGLVYRDGVYHLYFQYNPFDTQWDNMSWGHAVSTDLLHWKQQDTVLFPDETGTIFSGSGIINEQGMLGLPREAMVFFYTAAGNTNRWSKGLGSTQRVAYSVDGGYTLMKLGKRGMLGSICHEERDPKVFWHAESEAYIMVLWLEENDFGIFRSADLEKWKQSDRVTLEKAFECPDLVNIPDKEGTPHWMFWCADGFYFWGEFDGYRFKTDGIRHEAYMNKVPYAAQSYSGISGRVVQIPWLRLPNAGRIYTGAMGIPRELGIMWRDNEKFLTLKVANEVTEWYKNNTGKQRPDAESVLLDVMCDEQIGKCYWKVGKCEVSYDMESGLFAVNRQKCRLRAGIHDFSFLLDSHIFEVTADCGTIMGAFEVEI